MNGRTTPTSTGVASRSHTATATSLARPNSLASRPQSVESSPSAMTAPRRNRSAPANPSASQANVIGEPASQSQGSREASASRIAVTRHGRGAAFDVTAVAIGGGLVCLIDTTGASTSSMGTEADDGRSVGTRTSGSRGGGSVARVGAARHAIAAGASASVVRAPSATPYRSSGAAARSILKATAVSIPISPPTQRKCSIVQPIASHTASVPVLMAGPLSCASVSRRSSAHRPHRACDGSRRGPRR